MIHPVVCPACGHAQEFKAWASINPATDPELRSALLEGQLELFVCDACKAQTRVAFDVLYHDMRRTFMIWLCHENETLQPPDRRLPAVYQFRVVRTVPGLVEKIRIFEDQFDDRMMELFKVSLWSTLNAQQRGTNGRLYYAGTQTQVDPQMEFILLRQDGSERLFISKGREFQPFAIQAAGLMAKPLSSHTWWNINEEYAAAELTKAQMGIKLIGEV